MEEGVNNVEYHKNLKTSGIEDEGVVHRDITENEYGNNRDTFDKATE